MKRCNFEVHDKFEFQKQLKSSAVLYKKVFEKIANSKLFFNFGNDFETASLLDLLRICRHISADNGIENSIANIYINMFVDAEKRVSGSGIIAIAAFVDFFPKLLKLHNIGSQNHLEFFEKKVRQDLHEFLKKSRRSSSKEIFDVIRHLNSSLEAFDMVENVLASAGASGNIDIEKTENDITTIEKKEGNRFDIKLDQEFLKCITAKEIKIESPKILIVDGIIEGLGEIEGLLRVAHRDSGKLAIFARGYNEGVAAYLASNFTSKIIEVFPFVANFDEFGANQLVDLAICAGSDVASSLKGDSLDLITWEQLPSFDSITIERQSIKVFNSSSQDRCARQRKKLLNLLGECNNIDEEAVKTMKIKIINKRINSMTPSNTSLRIGKKRRSLQGITYDRVCKSIEIYNEMSRWGIVSKESLEGKGKNSIEGVLNIVDSCGMTKMSPRMIDAGTRVAISSIKNSLSVGAWLKNEAA